MLYSAKIFIVGVCSYVEKGFETMTVFGSKVWLLHENPICVNVLQNMQGMCTLGWTELSVKHVNGSGMTQAMFLHSYVPYSSNLLVEEMSGSQIFAP